MNPQVYSWLDGGRIVEALLGRGAYFIADHTYRTEHDRVLVLGQMLQWAAERDRVQDAADAFVEALREIAETGDVDDAYDLVWTYLLVADEWGPLPIDHEVLLRGLDELDRSASGEVTDATAEVRRLVRERIASTNE